MTIRTRLLITLIIVILFSLLARAAQNAEAESFGVMHWLIPIAALMVHQSDARLPSAG